MPNAECQGNAKSEARMACLELIRELIGDEPGIDIRHSDFFSHSSLTATLEFKVALSN